MKFIGQHQNYKNVKWYLNFYLYKVKCLIKLKYVLNKVQHIVLEKYSQEVLSIYKRKTYVKKE